jgi:hypothetical protein
VGILHTLQQVLLVQGEVEQILVLIIVVLVLAHLVEVVVAAAAVKQLVKVRQQI